MEPVQLMRNHRKDRGALLGVVMILLAIIMAASGFAFWSMRADTNSTSNDRLTRQLFDCAERALSLGKWTFSQNRQFWDSYFGTNVCGTLPCTDNGGPFPTGATGTAPTNYPTGGSYSGTIKIGADLDASGNPNKHQQSYTYNIGLYNDPEFNATNCPGDATCRYHDGGNNLAVVWARCTDTTTKQWRSVQAVISQQQTSSGCPYRAQAGASCRGNGNQN